MVAFANTNGGKIYIGIGDDGSVIGLKNIKEDIESLSGMIREGIKSDLTMYTKISEEVIKKMLIENQGDSFEILISKNQDLHFEELEKLFEKRNIELNESKYKTLNIVDLNNNITNLGLLLSEECPYTIKCAIYNGSDKVEFKDRREFTGSILKQVQDVFEYLDLYNKTKGKIIGLERIDIKDYPEYALREALLNAVIHRDYNYTGSILISLFEDSFEITSLGGLVKGLNIEEIYLGVSESRNPNLANIFYRLKYVESFGTGIERIIQSYKKYDKKPLLIDSENAFKVKLYNVNYVENNTKVLLSNLTQEEQIIEYLKKNNKITRLIVESLLDISTTRAKIILKNMIMDNLIMVKGNGKNIIYELK